ncbi:MAG: CARDB domain-containing protein [Methanomassiliicoccales archaeon]
MGWRKKISVLIIAFLTLSVIPTSTMDIVMYTLAAQPTNGVIVNSQVAGNQLNPKSFVSKDGTIYVVWEDVSSNGSRIFLSKSVDGGITFSPRIRVDDIPSGMKCIARDPSVVVNSTGCIFVAWSDNRTGTYQIYFSSSSDGVHFSTDALVAPTSNWVNQTMLDMTIENDNLYLVWSQQHPSANDNTYVKFTYSTDSGVTFSSAVRIDSTVNVKELYPSISVKGRKVVIAWHDSRDNPLFDIRVSISNNNGQTFSSSIKVSTSTSIENWYPSAEILPDGRVFIAWQQRNGGNFDVFGVISTINDQTYSLPSLLIGGVEDQTFISSAVESRGIIWLAYRSVLDGRHVVQYSRSLDGQTFSTPISLNPNTTSEQNAVDVVCDDNGTVYFVFQDDGQGTEDIMFCKIENERPEIDILSPTIGWEWSNRVNLAGTCKDPDNSPVLKVFIQIKEKNGTIVLPWSEAVVTNMSVWNISIDTTIYKNGQYEIFAKSFDGVAYSIVSKLEAVFNNGIQPFVEFKIEPSDISYTPLNPKEGDIVTVSAKVSNLGNKDAEYVQIRFLLEGYNLGTVIIPRLPAGLKDEAILNCNCLEGTFELRVIVDPENQFEEPNETDNSALIYLTVLPKPEIFPDLAIDSNNITWSPSIIHKNDVVIFTAKIVNVGKILVNDVKVEFQINNQYYDYCWTGQILPGEFFIVQTDWNTNIVGNYTLTIIIDPYPKQLNEERIDNNQASLAFSVFPENTFKPDLMINNATVIIQPASPKMGQVVIFTAIVSNLGDITADMVQVTFYVDDLLLGSPLTIPQIGPGETIDITTAWTAAIGERMLKVKIDEIEVIKELNESNNVVIKYFIVYPPFSTKPDLKVSSQNISYYPNPPIISKPVRFNITIWNLGNDSAYNIKVQVKIDGKQLGNTIIIPYIYPYSSINISVIWIAKGGQHSFQVILDPDDEVEEWDVEENEAQITLSLPPEPLEIPWMAIFAFAAFSVLGYGVYSYLGKVKKKKGGES